MQWIFMLVGLILGGFAGESLVGALLGGLSGLALGQAVSLQNLAQQNERLRKQMSEFAERFERGTEVIHQRLLRVERQAQDLPESVPEPAAGIDQRGFAWRRWRGGTARRWLGVRLETPRNGWRCRWSTATPGWRWQRWRCSASAGGCASGAPPTA